MKKASVDAALKKLALSVTAGEGSGSKCKYCNVILVSQKLLFDGVFSGEGASCVLTSLQKVVVWGTFWQVSQLLLLLLR